MWSGPSWSEKKEYSDSIMNKHTVQGLDNPYNYVNTKIMLNNGHETYISSSSSILMMSTSFAVVTSRPVLGGKRS
jgi:hypothetical protein